jgi:hypothetical protein
LLVLADETTDVPARQKPTGMYVFEIQRRNAREADILMTDADHVHSTAHGSRYTVQRATIFCFIVLYFFSVKNLLEIVR